MPRRPAHRAALALLLATLGACAPSEKPKAAPRKPEPAPIPVTTPAPLPTPTPAARSFSSFRPTLHGFRFPNRFTGSPLPFSLGGLEKHLSLPNHYGLCGGMSFAAADFFLARIDPPALTDPPDNNDALYTYLYTRQIDSLGESLALVPKFARWMALPDAAVIGTPFLTLAALPGILSSLEAGQPTLLGLVLTSTAQKGKIWENHQVLAYASDSPAPGTLRILIYDPNYPHADGASLVITPQPGAPLVLATGMGGPTLLAMPSPGVKVTRVVPGRREFPIRGFFQMPYTPKTPPLNVQPDPPATTPH